MLLQEIGNESTPHSKQEIAFAVIVVTEGLACDLH
jgi:hypothetical protein